VPVLIVKTSSLGDVVHTLPAVSDARAARTDLEFDWVVESAFAEIPGWHPAVRAVIPCALRRWRRSPLQALGSGEWGRFRQQLRGTQYELVLDAQGLLKSAWLAGCARGPRVGPDRRSAREPLAAAFYQRGIRLPERTQSHAVQRLRLLFAAALGYPLPATPPDFGLKRTQFAESAFATPYCVLLHATTWPSKAWPERSWIELGLWLKSRGLRCVLPWGSDAERHTSERIAAAVDGIAPPRMRLTELAGVLAHARFVVGVDTGLAHLAAAVATPSVTLYGPTLPGLTGTVGANQIHLRSTDASTIDRARPTTVAVAGVQEAISAWL
jgi:heptosyltransferase-1